MPTSIGSVVYRRFTTGVRLAVMGLVFLPVVAGVQAPPPQGRILIVTEAAFNQQAREAIPQRVLENARALGWIQTQTGFEHTTAIPNSYVIRSGQARPSQYELLAVINEDVSGSTLFYRGSEIDARFFIFRVRQTTGGIELQLRWRRFGSQAGEHHNDTYDPGTATGQSQQPPDKISYTCLDYNGWLGDQTHHAHWSIQALINFLGSDCSLAYRPASCWRDQTSSPVCHSSQTCSVVIKHAQPHHSHTSPTGPPGL